jgi:hypothetical protein
MAQSPPKSQLYFRILLPTMNPSAKDWIPKFLSYVDHRHVTQVFPSTDAFYDAVRQSGFIYGNSVSLITPISELKLKMSSDELTKLNLFYCLLYVYGTKRPHNTTQDGISEILKFYSALEKRKTSFFNNLSNTTIPSNQLEQILSRRLQESNSLYKSKAISLLTHALLFIDILAFDQYLQKSTDIKSFASLFEDHAVSCAYLALKAKKKKNKYDSLLIDLFDTSAEYIIKYQSFQKSLTDFSTTTDNLIEKKYMLDVACLAVWEDTAIDNEETAFLNTLCSTLNISEELWKESMLFIQKFNVSSLKKLTLFEHSTPIKQFYKQATHTVKKLILRNKSRLVLELKESGELLKLLGNSTQRDLSKEEKEKVKEQLLDICKTIPSLTIFILPGGTILLPLLVKFIPKLLPSAFDENRIEKK